MKPNTEKNLQAITVPIVGMHCRSCEILIEEKLKEIPEVTQVEVKYKKGTADIFFHEQKPNHEEIETAIREAGYAIGVSGKKPFFSKNVSDYQDLGIAALVLLMLFVVVRNLGLTSLSFVSSSSSGATTPAVIFLVGLTAGLSTCMALVGGLILGISARHAEKHPEATALQKFRPHLFFNLGRIASYVALGGLLGALGSFLNISGTPLGMLTLVIGIAMLLLGLKLIGIFPRLESVNFTLPKSVSRWFGSDHQRREYSHRNAAALGALTFFLPCGFTQSMQLLAIGSGSFASGAFIMGLFALGTAPGLLGLGGIASAVKGIFAQRFFKFAGIVVILFALFNISNGLNLTGWQGVSVFGGSGQVSTKNVGASITKENGIQIIRMTQGSRGYSPQTLTVEKGTPVRMIVTSTDPYSCASSIVIPKFGIRKNLQAGENTIEFTPTETGNIPFSCSMGMYTGTIVVVEAGSAAASTGGVSSVASGTGTSGGGASCGAGGCGGCGMMKGVAQPETKAAPAPESESGKNGTAQILKTTYTLDKDIVPNTFAVRAGSPVRLEVDVKENGEGCMSTIMVPGLSNTPQYLEKGKTIAMEFTPVKSGSYQITCAMGVPRGTITVE
jgi:sulfite exporter TauE/SafE/plastocyanin domain-containing protein/copper chaperone CopZ